LFLSCLGWALFTIWGFKANKLLDISVANLISQLSLVLTFFASAILFREAVTVYKVFGIILLIIGNIIVIKGPRKKGIVNKEGLKYRIMATLAMSVALLIDAANSPNFSVSFYNCGAFLLSGLIMLPLARIKWQEVKAELKINWKGQLLMAIFSSVAYYLLIKSMALAPKTIVVPVNNLSTVFVVLLGVILLKEANNTKRKLIAAALAFGGAVLLSI
jgi:transporter family protein